MGTGAKNKLSEKQLSCWKLLKEFRTRLAKAGRKRRYPSPDDDNRAAKEW